MIHQYLLPQIVAFGKAPSQALVASSPHAREALEHRGMHAHVCNHVSFGVGRSHLSRNDNSQTVYRVVQCSPEIPQYLQNLRACLWWLRRESRGVSRDIIPLSLRFPPDILPDDDDINNNNNNDASNKEGEEEEEAVSKQQRTQERTRGLSPIKLADMTAYLQLHSLRVLTLQTVVVRHLVWLRLCSRLESLSLYRVKVIQDDFESVAAHLPHLRVLKLESLTMVSSMAWITACRQLRELTMLGVTSSYQQHAVCLAELEHLTALSISLEPTHDMNWIAACRKLEWLDLAAEATHVFPELHELRNLKYLKVKLHQPFTATTFSLPGGVGLYDTPLRLARLDLSDGHLSQVAWLRCCPFLEELNLRRCEALTDFSPLGALSRLRKLDISATRVRSVEWIVGCAASLVELSMDSCEMLTNFLPIQNLRRLLFLSINGNRSQHCSAVWLPSCDALEHLHASRCFIDLNTLDALKNLRTVLVSVSDKFFTSSTSVNSLSQCSLLETVDLSGRDNIISFSPLCRLQHLRILDLRYTGITTIEQFAACPRLEDLRIEPGIITDMWSIIRFPSLCCVQLSIPHRAKLPAIEAALSMCPYVSIEYI